MALTGRFVALLALGAVPIIVLDAQWVLVAWIVLVILLTALDLALAASPRAVRVSRDLPARVRLGESVRAELILTNTGTRGIRGVVRDA